MSQRVVTVTDEEKIDANNRVTVVASFGTIAEAEEWIAARETVDPEKVHRGGYGINAPECFA
jgi:hypothetical protein